MSEVFAVAGDRIVTEDGLIAGHIVVEADKIRTVASGPPPPGYQTIVANDRLVVPGFIDLHIHGAGGWDTSAPQSVLNLARILAENGVAAFYPTPATTDPQSFLGHLSSIREAKALQQNMGGAGGAEILGIHIEGPFLNPEQKGAMPEEHLLNPDSALMERFENCAPGLIKRVTLAPELPGALAFITWLCQRGYAVAGGHTAASAEETKAGVAAGITIANHLFNAVTGLHHRAPGAVGAYLTAESVTCELIADGIHVHPLAIEIALRCKGPEQSYLVSDAILAAGLAPGTYTFLNRRIVIDEEGVSRQADGTIAGSTRLLAAGFKTIVKTMGHSPLLAARLTATNPAALAGVALRKGALAPGKDADITVLNPDFTICCCCARGVWHKLPPQALSENQRPV